MKYGNGDSTRDYFVKYYISLVEIKYFNVLIDNKPFFDQPVKNKQKAYKKLSEFNLYHTHSKQLFTGHLYDACAKTSDIVLIKIVTSPGVEIRIAFLICYLQSLYEIELGHYFCPEFVGHVTNQNILVDAGKLM